MGLLDQRVAFITGAASGIGYEMARHFAGEGAIIAIADLNAGAVASSAERLRQQGYKVIGLPCDVSNEEQVAASVQRVVEEYGRLEILINNAGLQHVSPIEEFPTECFELLLKVMLVGPFLGIKHAFPIMKQQGYGRILNMSSINGLIGFAGKAAYNSAKHGVIGLTKVAALEGAVHGITVNALCPGYVDTPLVQNQLKDLAITRNVPLEKVLEEVIYPFVPQKRLLSVEEIADYASMLVSDRLKGVTGIAAAIDGGYTAQ
ncbi:3-hydroxybutyrate dehydrogenase [Brevibacillus halotolerans]|uniref:3-hydroxybutyrate dehydrogenase n=1 Tax=Brevibacillus halotolerans TaxID=1507437 RepID=UPI001B154EC8|nr:3-hydroxybutyrate dehydrogenase [Brevibacillus halotolerans]GIO01956.1 3-hydroxybutyrate dehydrogenase [Brevibacillus halotolerans]